MAPTPQAALATSATNLNLSGSAAALGRAMTRVTWTNYANNATGVASGTNDWSVTSISLVADKTNVVVIVGPTASWAPAFGGNTTFNDALTVIQAPIRAALTWQETGALLNWTGGGPPYHVQRATDLIVGDWTDFLPNATPPVSLPLDGPGGLLSHYRAMTAWQAGWQCSQPKYHEYRSREALIVMEWSLHIAKHGLLELPMGHHDDDVATHFTL